MGNTSSTIVTPSYSTNEDGALVFHGHVFDETADAKCGAFATADYGDRRRMFQLQLKNGLMSWVPMGPESAIPHGDDNNNFRMKSMAYAFTHGVR